MKKYKGHIIGTTACLGGELGTAILAMEKCESVADMDNKLRYHQQIVDFMQFCISVFEDDFYVECAPASTPDQIKSK